MHVKRGYQCLRAMADIFELTTPQPSRCRRAPLRLAAEDERLIIESTDPFISEAMLNP
jgi:hypothetical protein